MTPDGLLFPVAAYGDPPIGGDLSRGRPVPAHPADFANPDDQALRAKGYYLKRPGHFVGFGRLAPQLDLFKTEYRLGFWILGVCRVCLETEIGQLRATVTARDVEIEQHKVAIRIAKGNVGSAIEIMERKKGPPA